MLRADLADARKVWLNETETDHERRERERTSFLAYCEGGRVFDFHALRHQFASGLAAGDVHPKTAQELLRHSAIGLTMDVYTHTGRGKLSAALDALPDLSHRAREAVRATGTDEAIAQAAESNSASYSARKCTEQCNPVQYSAVNIRCQGEVVGQFQSSRARISSIDQR